MRGWAVALALVAVVSGGPVATPAAGAAAPTAAGHAITLIAMPDLRWSDLSAMPRLSALMATGAVGELSVRSEGEATRCGDALLQLSAGTRVPSGVRSCDIDPVDYKLLQSRYRHGRYGAHVGLLGDALTGHSHALGPGGAVILGTTAAPAPQGGVPALVPSRTIQVAVIEGFYGARDRHAAAVDIDAGLAQTLRQLPAGGVVIVAGISDGPTGGPRLHPIVVSGPGWSHRELTSASTGRAPFVQLFDLTATLLQAQGVTELPRTVSGRAIRMSSAHVRALSAYADMDRHARRALNVGHPTFTGLSVALLVVLLLLLVRPSVAAWPARLLVFAPLATWLVQLLPWWRHPLAIYVAFVVGFAVIGAAALWLVGRRSSRAALLLGPAVTAGVLLTDQMLGAPLQTSAPLGDNPLVAGRFHGMGNIDFGVSMAAALLCLAVLAAERTRRTAVVTVVAGGLVALVIDGAPPLGDDIGGILALVPAVALLAALVARARVSARRVIPVGVVTVVVAIGAALADYARPEDKRTHAGRFVEDVRDGTAWQTLHRKLDAVLSSFTNPVVTGLVVVAIALAVVAARRPGWAAAIPDDGVRAAVPAVAVLAVIGAALNDSGVFVAAAALFALVPATVAAEQYRKAGPSPALGDTEAL